ncbi:hypothetical protein [Nitriliruptor alkaliphilus]|uniref:hypothetical protein n=1 Tax=Nitriliruptor alkaliphilus TaxID=427918 RepID=UPI0006977BDF|nr:hypothetical protein [Nitriliruptor alkaliphilus]
MSVKRIAKNSSNVVKGEPDRRATAAKGRPVRRGGLAGHDGGLAKGLERALQGALGGKRKRRR